MRKAITSASEVDAFGIALETALYLASLVPNPKTIDPILDTVRAVTSRNAATQDDIDALQETRLKLEDYLINKDPTRAFTHEELQQKIKEHLFVHRLNVLRRYLYGVIAGMITVYIIAFLLPGAGDSDQRSQLGSSLSLLVMSAGATWFFLAARKKFKPELRSSYTLLCVSSILLGLSQIQLPIVAYWNLGSTPLFRYGSITTPTLVTMICIYFALRRYANIISLPRSPLSSLKVIGAICVVTGALAIAIPHGSHPQNEALFDLSMANTSITLVIVIITSLLAHQIARVTAKVYAKAMNLLAITQFCAAIGLAVFVVALYNKGALFGTDLAVIALPFILSNTLWLVSSYSFKKATEY